MELVRSACGQSLGVYGNGHANIHLIWVLFYAQIVDKVVVEPGIEGSLRDRPLCTNGGDSPTRDPANVQVGRAKGETSCRGKGDCASRESASDPAQIVRSMTGCSGSGGERWTRILSG